MKKLLTLLGIMTTLLFIAVVPAQSQTSDQSSSLPPAGKFSSVEELKDKRIGVVTGSSFDAVARNQFPDAQINYYNNTTDMITALKTGKTDCFLADEPVILYLMGENKELTKMGDLVRSRTYEAFFPLIAVAVIYFALEGVFGFIVGRIARILNPKRRKQDAVLKDIQTDDQ